METKREIRMAELRALPPEPETNERVVEGYAVRFEEPTTFTVWGETVTEVIDRHALDSADLSDVPFKYNHSDAAMIMARTRSGTLTLRVEEQGLFVRAQLADTTQGRDLYELIRRGDIDKMSFAFTVREDSWDKESKTRRIRRIDKLYDVSAVDLPAYDTTSLHARAASYLEQELLGAAVAQEAERRTKIMIRTR